MLFLNFLFFIFETKSYSEIDVPISVFVILESATLTTLSINYVIQKNKIRFKQMFGLFFAIIGLFLVLRINSTLNSWGGIYSSILAGIGYGLFLTFSKKFKIGLV